MTVRRGGLALALVLVTAAAIAALFAGRAAPDGAGAASHREAPLISLDPAADISDFFLFRSYEPGKADRVVLIMNVNPGEEPSSGPNYYAFDPSVTYSIGIDNDRDGKADDVRFDVRFANEIRGFTKDLGLPLRYVGGGPLPVVDDVDDPGNGLRQTYQVTMNGKKLHDGSLPVLAGQRRPADDAELRGELPLGGRQDARRRDPRVRRPAGRSVLHRPRRRVRHAQPQSVRAGLGHRHARRAQRAHDRDRGADRDDLGRLRRRSAPTGSRRGRRSRSGTTTARSRRRAVPHRCRCSASRTRSSTS